MTPSSEEDIRDFLLAMSYVEKENRKKNYRVDFRKKPIKDTRLKRNRVKCLSCGKIIESTYRHDFKTCGCSQQTMVDGGLAYERYGGKDMSLVEPMFEYQTYYRDPYDWEKEEDENKGGST